MTEAALERIIRSGKAEDCLRFFAGMAEKDRRSLAPVARRELEAAWQRFDEALKRLRRTTKEKSLPTAILAVQATASLSELKKLGWRAAPRRDEEAITVVRDRRPPWLDAWANWLLEQNYHHWPLVRRFVREELCAAPESEFYVLGMINKVAGYRGHGQIAEALLADRELLESHLWRLFELEGGGDLSLATHDKYASEVNTWSHALKCLAEQGAINRRRLLDASLDALSRDFAQFRAGWFSRFHEALQPTLDERAERGDAYLALLASPIPPTVAFTLKALKILHKAGKVDGRAFVAHAEPVLHAKAKSSVKTALSLLADFAKAEPALRPEVALIAAAGLEHGDRDVQESALKLIETFGEVERPDLRGAVEERLSMIAAPFGSRVAAWLGTADSPDEARTVDTGREALPGLVARARALPHEEAALAGIDSLLAELDAANGEIPAAPFDGTDIPRLSTETELKPIEAFDELVELFLQAIEDPDDVERIELILDGLARLGGRRGADFALRTEPLARRIEALNLRRNDWGWNPSGPFEILCSLAKAWLDTTSIPVLCDKSGEPYFEHAAHEWALEQGNTWTGTRKTARFYLDTLGATAVFWLRAVHVARCLAENQTAPLLGTSTHRGGWIAPRILVERSLPGEAGGAQWDLADQVLALLRLAPDRRPAALKEARSVEGEWGAALRHALGAENEAIGATTPLWVAAARSRSPFADDVAVERAFPDLGPDAGRAARIDYTVTVDKHPEITFHHFRVECEPAAPAPYEGELDGVIGGLSRLFTAVGPKCSVSLLPTVALHRRPSRFYTAGDGLAIPRLLSPWTPILWPSNPESVFAAGALDASWHDHEPRPASTPPPLGYGLMLDPDVPLRDMGRVMLCLGLNARDAEEGRMATDALIEAIEDGRLDGDLLGRSMGGLLFTGIIKPKRWAPRLRETAGASPLHAQTLRQAIGVALQGEAGKAPRDLHALMELLHELSIEAGEAVRLPETRRFLEGFPGSGKAAKLAKALLGLAPAENQAYRRAAATHALAARLDRAERWLAMAARRGVTLEP